MKNITFIQKLIVKLSILSLALIIMAIVHTLIFRLISPPKNPIVSWGSFTTPEQIQQYPTRYITADLKPYIYINKKYYDTSGRKLPAKPENTLKTWNEIIINSFQTQTSFRELQNTIKCRTFISNYYGFGQMRNNKTYSCWYYDYYQQLFIQLEPGKKITTKLGANGFHSPDDNHIKPFRNIASLNNTSKQNQLIIITDYGIYKADFQIKEFTTLLPGNADSPITRYFILSQSPYNGCNNLNQIDFYAVQYQDGSLHMKNNRTIPPLPVQENKTTRFSFYKDDKDNRYITRQTNLGSKRQKELFLITETEIKRLYTTIWQVSADQYASKPNSTTRNILENAFYPGILLLTKIYPEQPRITEPTLSQTYSGTIYKSYPDKIIKTYNPNKYLWYLIIPTLINMLIIHTKREELQTSEYLTWMIIFALFNITAFIPYFILKSKTEPEPVILPAPKLLI